MAGEVADELRRQILGGEIAEGTQLMQEQLAAQFGISKVPIREALFQLEAEGFVMDYLEARHAQTLAGIAQGLGAMPEPQLLPGLNEYDSQALISAIHPAPLPRPDTPELYRQHFRLLCDALAQWMAGTISPAGMPGWDGVSGGVRAALEQVRRQHVGGSVLLVSSGGPIAAAVGEVLRTPPEVTIALNMRIRNSAVTEFSISPKRLMLQTFNTLPHLNEVEHAPLVTHA